MSQSGPPREVPPPMDTYARIDGACDRFEAAWLAGGRPRIEDYLASESGDTQARLLYELLRIDLEYRGKAGEQPGREEYRGRFPAWDAAVDRLFEGEAGTAAGRGETSSPAVPEGHTFRRLISYGGMGVVYLAWHHQACREVAVKVIRAGELATLAERQRFVLEAQSAAGLEHPNIVRIYEVGTVAGQPWFSMEYAAGGSLARPGAEVRASPRRAAELVAAIARAVHFAHQRGIIHRDLKPANVLLAADGTPKVADFGLAKRTSGNAEHDMTSTAPAGLNGEQDTAPYVSSSERLTAVGAVVGTASYMAPEQASGASQITMAADVYGLGAILYELLTGRPPFEGQDLREIIQKVKDEEPIPPRAINKGIHQDLEAICLKCLRKAPEGRYADATRLATDLYRFLAGEPVTARPVSRLVRVGKQIRRQPRIAALWAAVFLLSTVLVVGGTWQLMDFFARYDGELHRSYTHGVGLAALMIDKGEFEQAQQLLDECPRELRGWDWYYLSRRCRVPLVRYVGHTRNVLTVCYSPDGTQLLTGSEDSTARLWDAATGKVIHVLDGKHLGEVRSCFTDHGRTVVTAGIGDQHVYFWDAKTGTTKGDPFRDIGDLIACDTAGTRLAAVGRNHLFTVRDPTRRGDPLLVRKPLEDEPTCMRMSPDGQYLALCGFNKLFLVLNLVTGKEVPIDKPSVQSWAVAFSADSRYLAAGLRQLHVWDLLGAKFDHEYTGQWFFKCCDLDFSPCGKRLAASYRDGFVRVWDTEKKTSLRAPHQVLPKVYPAIRFSPDGKSLAVTRGCEVTAETLYGDPPPLWRQELKEAKGNNLDSIAFSPDGRWLASRDVEGRLFLWDVERGMVHQEMKAARVNNGGGLAFHPNTESALLIAGGQDAPAAWQVPAGELAQIPLPRGKVRCLALGPRPKPLLATSDGGNSIWLHDLTPDGKGKPPQSLAADTVEIQTLAFHPRGDKLAAAGSDGILRFWSVPGGKLLQPLEGHTGQVMALAYSPDGRFLASGGGDETVRLWDLHTGKSVEKRVFRCVTGLAFTSDGKRLASCANDGVIKIWDTRTGTELFSMNGHSGATTAIAFSPDPGSNLLASCGHDGVVRLWDGSHSDNPLTLSSGGNPP